LQDRERSSVAQCRSGKENVRSFSVLRRILPRQWALLVVLHVREVERLERAVALSDHVSVDDDPFAVFVLERAVKAAGVDEHAAAVSRGKNEGGAVPVS